MSQRFFLCAVLGCLSLFNVSAFASPSLQKTDKVSAELISESNRWNPKKDLDFLIHLKMSKGWHTYWKNPGDIGLDTNFKWKLPQGYQVELITQSIPQIFKEEGIVQYGYAEEAYYRFRLKAPTEPSLTVEKLPLQVDVSWLACKDECVPETVFLSKEFTLTHEPQESSPSWESVLSRAHLSFPLKRVGSSWYEFKDNNLYLHAKMEKSFSLRDVKNIYFLPYQQNLIATSIPQKIGFNPVDSLVSIIAPLTLSHQIFPEGVLMIETSTHSVGYEFSPQKAQGLQEFRPLFSEDVSLLWVLGMAFLGGVILNFMPCIFPVLSLKALALVQNFYNRQDSRSEAIFYFCGVMCSFLFMASLLLILRLQGESIGWGFQLQSPVFVGVMIGLFVFIFLLLMDWVHFNLPVISRLGTLTFSTQKLNAFVTGLFSVLIASPCTAPFMGVAIGYTLTKPIYIYYPIFMALSIGYALPFTLIAIFPDFFVKFLPKPGKWMLTLKKVFAIPVLLTCLWLGWVFYHLVGQEKTELHKIQWMTYDTQKVERYLEQKEPVFIVFTAKWCLTCLVNEKVALDTKEFYELVTKKKIHLFKADWTHKDENISQALESYGRNSVPLYVFYSGQNFDYVVLPQLLTVNLVKDYLR